MTLLRSIAFDLLFYSSMTVFGVLLAPVVIASPRTTVYIIRTYCRVMLGALRIICGLRTEVRGTIPTGTVVVAGKHQSFLDILILVVALDQPSFVMKRELLAAPIFGWYAKRLGCIAIDRSAGREAMRAILEQVDQHQSTLGQLVIYPQGTRVAPGAHRPYKPGAAAVYASTGLPCVPAATNAGMFWGRNSWLRKPGRAVVEFLPPLPSGLAQDSALAHIETVVEEASSRLLTEATQPHHS